MRFSILFISCLLILAGCTNSHPVKQEVSKPKALHIALLPLSKADTNTINFLQQELHSYFKCQVDILPPQPIPPVYLNKEKGERYSADSLLHFISRYKTDSKATDAIQLICKTRGLNVPDIDEQLNWLRSRQ